AGSVAVSGGSELGVGLGGAGASATNKIATEVKAYIQGDGLNTGSSVSAGSVSLSAYDTSNIRAKVGAAALAIAVAPSGPGISLSLGVALARNDIHNTIAAYITQEDVTAMRGAVSIAARESAGIDVDSVAASLAVSFGQGVG